MIRQAAAADLPALAALWKTCFGDEDDYPERFLARCITSEGSGVLCAEEDGGICASACLVSEQETSGQTGAYLYAVCTHPARRGRGIARAIIEEAKRRYPFLLLIPAKASLYAYYRRLGFTTPLLVPVRTAIGSGERLTPALLPHPDFADLIEEAFSCAPQEGFSEKKEAGSGKIYEMCYTDGTRSVIIEESGLGTEALAAGTVCGVLPV